MGPDHSTSSLSEVVPKCYEPGKHSGNTVGIRSPFYRVKHPLVRKTAGKTEQSPMVKTPLQLASGADSVFRKRRCGGTGLKTMFPVLIAFLGYGAGEQFLQVSAFQRSSFYHDVINFSHGFPLLVFAHYTDNDTLNLNPSPIQQDWFKRRVCRLQPDLAAFGKKLFERDIFLVYQGDNGISGSSSLAGFNDDIVPILNVLIDHRLSLYTQDKVVAPPREKIFRYLQNFRGGHRLDRLTGSDIAEQWQIPYGRCRRLRKLDRARAVGISMEVTAAFQSLQMLKNSIQGGKMEMPGDLLHTGRVPVVIYEPGDEIENLFLAFGKFHDFTFSPPPILGGEMVKVNKKS
jgi:hypothetical protein